jgi:hypothetical protein
MTVEHSRAVLLASRAAGEDVETLTERLARSQVVVRVDPSVPSGLLAARVLLTTLRRLPVGVWLDPSGLDVNYVAQLAAAVNAIDSTRPLNIVNGAVDAAAHVHIGLQAAPGWTRVVPDGYGAQLANDPDALMTIALAGNGLGGVFAAALAAAEAFKGLAGVLPARRTNHPHLSFCPVSLTADTTQAPELPPHLPLDIALVGTGAVGTAEALILSELALGGRIIVCDPERFEPENRSTYSVGGEAEAKARPRKLDLVGDLLAAAGYDVHRVAAESTDLIRSVDSGELAAPSVVLSGLDSIAARRETQGLWPDHLIDAATGDTAVGLSHAVPEGPCLRCFFPDRRSGESAIERVAQATGLPLDRLRHGQEPLTDADVAALTRDQQELLRDQRGKPVCGLAQALGLTDAPGFGYMPSVSFVSQIAACLGVGRLLAVQLGHAPQANWLQFDALHGPHADGDRRLPDPECFCQTRPGVVAQLRALRAG